MLGRSMILLLFMIWVFFEVRHLIQIFDTVVAKRNFSNLNVLRLLTMTGGGGTACRLIDSKHLEKADYKSNFDSPCFPCGVRRILRAAPYWPFS